MTFETMDAFVNDDLATQTEDFLDARAEHFSNYFGENDYFNEATIQSVMVYLLTRWIVANDPNETTMVMTELNYPGFANRSDIAVVYLTEDGEDIDAKQLFIELKADFTADSVNADINLLDLIAGSGNSPIDEAYAFYVVFNNDTGWTDFIEDPTQPNVYTKAISVDPVEEEEEEDSV